MEPLSPYEIQELLTAMTSGLGAAPIGSLWSTSAELDTMFLVLHHANQETPHGPEPVIVMQALPSGEAWVFNTQAFVEAQWTHLGFVWDREVVS